MKVIINLCFGGFGLSTEAVQRLAELQGKRCFFFNYDFKEKKYKSISSFEAAKDYFTASYSENPEDEDSNIEIRDVDRNDPLLIQVVEELGDKSNGRYSNLTVVEISDDVKWHIEEYDRSEHVVEDHRTWS